MFTVRLLKKWMRLGWGLNHWQKGPRLEEREGGTNEAYLKADSVH